MGLPLLLGLAHEPTATMKSNRPQRLHILVIAPQPFYQDRGTPIAVRLLAGELAALGHRVDLLVYHEGEEIAIPGVTLHRSSAAEYLNNIPPGFSLKKILSDFRVYAKARNLIRENDYDLLHTVEEAVFMAMRFKKTHGIPYVYDMDSSLSIQLVDKIPVLAVFKPLLELFEKRAVKNSIGVVAVCQALVDQALRFCPSANIVRLEDINLQEEIPDGEEDLRLTFPIDGPLLLYVGNLENYQGIDLLFESIAVLKERDVPSHLALIGGSEKSINHYQASAERMNITSKVSFCGPRDIDLLGFYLAQADILVSPRIKGNNTPMKIYSYLGSGKPVLATNLPTHTQVLTPDVAYLSEADATSMADGLQYLLEHQQECERLGRNGKELVAQHYSLESYRKKLDGFYATLANNMRR